MVLVFLFVGVAVAIANQPTRVPPATSSVPQYPLLCDANTLQRSPVVIPDPSNESTTVPASSLSERPLDLGSTVYPHESRTTHLPTSFSFRSPSTTIRTFDWEDSTSCEQFYNNILGIYRINHACVNCSHTDQFRTIQQPDCGDYVLTDTTMADVLVAFQPHCCGFAEEVNSFCLPLFSGSENRFMGSVGHTIVNPRGTYADAFWAISTRICVDEQVIYTIMGTPETTVANTGCNLNVSSFDEYALGFQYHGTGMSIKGAVDNLENSSFIVFAPVNRAFDVYSMRNQLDSYTNRAFVSTLMLNHVVEQEAGRSRVIDQFLQNGTQFVTASGQRFSVRRLPGLLQPNGEVVGSGELIQIGYELDNVWTLAANVLRSEFTSRGWLHIIDSVITCPSRLCNSYYPHQVSTLSPSLSTTSPTHVIRTFPPSTSPSHITSTTTTGSPSQTSNPPSQTSNPPSQARIASTSATPPASGAACNRTSDCSSREQCMSGFCECVHGTVPSVYGGCAPPPTATACITVPNRIDGWCGNPDATCVENHCICSNGTIGNGIICVPVPLVESCFGVPRGTVIGRGDFTRLTQGVYTSARFFAAETVAGLSMMVGGTSVSVGESLDDDYFTTTAAGQLCFGSSEPFRSLRGVEVEWVIQVNAMRPRGAHFSIQNSYCESLARGGSQRLECSRSDGIPPLLGSNSFDGDSISVLSYASSTCSGNPNQSVLLTDTGTVEVPEYGILSCPAVETVRSVMMTLVEHASQDLNCQRTVRKIPTISGVCTSVDGIDGWIYTTVENTASVAGSSLRCEQGQPLPVTAALYKGDPNCDGNATMIYPPWNGTDCLPVETPLPWDLVASPRFTVVCGTDDSALPQQWNVPLTPSGDNAIEHVTSDPESNDDIDLGPTETDSASGNSSSGGAAATLITVVVVAMVAIVVGVGLWEVNRRKRRRNDDNVAIVTNEFSPMWLVENNGPGSGTDSAPADSDDSDFASPLDGMTLSSLEADVVQSKRVKIETMNPVFQQQQYGLQAQQPVEAVPDFTTFFDDELSGSVANSVPLNPTTQSRFRQTSFQFVPSPNPLTPDQVELLDMHVNYSQVPGTSHCAPQASSVLPHPDQELDSIFNEIDASLGMPSEQVAPLDFNNLIPGFHTAAAAAAAIAAPQSLECYDLGGVMQSAVVPDINIGLVVHSQPRVAGASKKASAGKQRDKTNSVDKKASKNDSKRVNKPKRFESMNQEEWQRGLKNAVQAAFSRLDIVADKKVADAVLDRIISGEGSRAKACKRPCFLVERKNLASKSPFQVQVGDARMVAQKAIFALYRKIKPNEMGTWQVFQECLHNDDTWWCFEPSHLKKCEKDHISAGIARNPMPRAADAQFLSKSRKSRKPVLHVESGNVSSPSASSPGDPISPSYPVVPMLETALTIDEVLV